MARVLERGYPRTQTKPHCADPFAYLKDVLERLPTHLATALSELLPDAWFKAHPGARGRATS